ncbi:MAG: hypothetical protein Q4C53_08545 [Clostridia bacterium]|nr:hypothetical protein [Clostridia bacterium]
MLKKSLVFALTLFVVLLLTADGAVGAKQKGKTAGTAFPAGTPDPSPAATTTETPAVAPLETPQPEHTPVQREFYAASAVRGSDIAEPFLEAVADRVRKETEGVLRFRIPEYFRTFTEAETVRALCEGEIDLLVAPASAVTKLLPSLKLLTTELLPSAADALSVTNIFQRENELTAILNAEAEPYGFRIAAVLPQRPLLIASDRELTKPEDFNDLLVIAETETAKAYYRALGATPQILDGEMLEDALDYPIANAWETTAERLKQRTPPETMPYLIQAGRTEEMSVVLIRQHLLDLISEPQKEILYSNIRKATESVAEAYRIPEGSIPLAPGYEAALQEIPEFARTREAFEKQCPGVLGLFEAELAKVTRP